MEHKSSHEGHKLGEACDHLKKMHREHGHDAPAAAHAKVQGKAREPMKAIDRMGRAGRKDG